MGGSKPSLSKASSLPNDLGYPSHACTVPIIKKKKPPAWAALCIAAGVDMRVYRLKVEEFWHAHGTDSPAATRNEATEERPEAQ